MPHVVFIHGIANKPQAEVLHKLWLNALSHDRLGNDDSLNLSSSGVSSSMIYWADVLYKEPLVETLLESVSGLESNEDVVKTEQEPDMSWRESLPKKEKAIIDSLAAKLSFDVLVDDTFAPPESEINRSLERIPIPWFLKRRLMKILLKDVHHYLFNFQFSPRPGTNYQVQSEIRSRVIKHLKEHADKPGPLIVVSHSMGTVIMYDCLKRVPDCPSIDALVTVGSPLGLDEVQDMLAPEWSRENGFPEKLKGPWTNIFDSLDPVTGFDGNIANDYKQNGTEVIEVINEQNWGSWRHNITNYFSEPKLRKVLRKLTGLN